MLFAGQPFPFAKPAPAIAAHADDIAAATNHFARVTDVLAILSRLFARQPFPFAEPPPDIAAATDDIATGADVFAEAAEAYAKGENEKVRKETIV